MEKLKLFIKKESTIEKIMILAGLLIVLWLNFFIFGVVMGKPLTFAYAESSIKVGLTVLPANPIEKTEKISPDSENQKSLSDLRASVFRLISPIENNADQNSAQTSDSERTILKKSIITFSGKAIYPNSEVLLEVKSDPFLTSVISDSQGNWTWTNWCHPLENGEHWLEASNIAPFELSGKRDIFIQRFKFFIKNRIDDKVVDQLALEKAVPFNKLDGVGNGLRLGNSEDVYLFNLSLLNKKEYNPGDDLSLQLLFNPLGKISNKEARVEYEIYGADENGATGQLISKLEDQIELSENQAFLKKIKLQEEISGGDYFIKVLVFSGGNKYVQSVKFRINPKVLIQIGETKIEQEKFSKIIVWNILVVVGLAILVLLLIIFEYRQLFMLDLVGPGTLKNRHYFS